jgi:hypothetical protein
MNSDIPRFWPQNPGQQPQGPQPEDILRDAAAELGRVTEHEVGADVRTRVDGVWLEHEFYLVSEKLGYRYLLFRARHRLGFPVSIYEGPREENASFDPLDSDFDEAIDDGRTECATSDDFEQALKQLFELPITQQIVGQLRHLSRQAS